MREADDELAEIKREIIESRGLVIKTNNLTNALSADIKSIAKRPQGYERRLSWNSATAYVVFVLVVLTAVKFAWDARVDYVTSETQQKSADNDRLRKETREAQKHSEDLSRAELKAQSFYELIRQGRRAEVVEGFDAIKNEPITKTELAFFTDAVERSKNELAAQSYLAGEERSRLQRWQEAATAFEESLHYKQDSAVANGARLGLAQAYRHLGRQKEAIPLLSQLAENNAVDKELQDDALYELATCQTDIQAYLDAKKTWRDLIARFPSSHYTPEAKMLLAQLNLMH